MTDTTNPIPELGELKLKDKTPVYVSLHISPENTEKLKDLLLEELKKQKVDNTKYKTVRNRDDPAHVTLIYYKDMSTVKEYEEFITKYDELLDKNVEFDIIGFASDSNCVAFTIDLKDIAYYPLTKKTHITMMLFKKPPVYSNQLLARLTAKDYKLSENERFVTFDKPVKATGKVAHSKDKLKN